MPLLSFVPGAEILKAASILAASSVVIEIGSIFASTPVTDTTLLTMAIGASFASTSAKVIEPLVDRVTSSSIMPATVTAVRTGRSFVPSIVMTKFCGPY